MKLRVLELLEQKHKTKYWLWTQLGTGYRNFDNMIHNRTKMIRFETIETLCQVLECTPNDLFDMEDDK